MLSAAAAAVLGGMEAVSGWGAQVVPALTVTGPSPAQYIAPPHIGKAVDGYPHPHTSQPMGVGSTGTLDTPYPWDV